MKPVFFAILFASTPVLAIAGPDLCDRSIINEIGPDEIAASNSISTVNLTCADGYSPLMLAISERRNDLIAAMIARGADLEHRNHFRNAAMHVAVLASNVGAVEVLLELGADPYALGSDGMTPLQFAETWGETEIATLLRSRGIQL